jgi:acyl-CoA dehydrogenase
MRGVAEPTSARPADPDAVTAVARQAAAVAADGAGAADRNAMFPAPAIDHLAAAGLLAAAAPVELGGLGCDPQTLVDVAGILARGCGSTAMIWAMHQLQIACVVRHCGTGQQSRDLLAQLISERALIASATSERGVGGNIRVSHAAVQGEGPHRSLDKQATTVSYGNQAGAFLITARRSETAAESDQVAVLIGRDQARLEVTGTWNPMGMRGTDSPAMRIRAVFDAWQILPETFGDIATATMIPLSHLLWSGVWAGLATEAFERARRLVRARHTRSAQPEIRLAQADEVLSGTEARLRDAVARYEPYYRAGESPAVRDLVRCNALKAASSEDAVRVAGIALEICGMAGYQEDGEYSIARILRDLYSARLMIANDRLRTANAISLLTVKRQ